MPAPHDQPVLITGGAGFIGSSLVRQWLTEEASPVVNLDKLTYAGHLASLESARDDARHTFVQGDVADLGLLRELFERHRPRAVLHLAAETHVDRSIDAPAPFFETNVGGAFALLEASLGYWRSLSADERDRFRFLHVSTDEVFGVAAPEVVFTESSPYAPNSPYAASKAAADQFVRAYRQTYGLPTLVAHPSNNYGPYQLPEKLIPLTIVRAAAGEMIPIYGDGGQQREWLHVADHTRALRMILARGRVGESYLIGGGQRPTNLELVREICALIDQRGASPPVRPCAQLLSHVADRPGHDRRYAVDTSKLREELGWLPQIDFSDGLRDTVRWYLRNAAWVAEATAALQAEG